MSIDSATAGPSSSPVPTTSALAHAPTAAHPSAATVDLAALRAVYAYARSPAPTGDDLQPLVREAVDVIERALEEHGEEHVAISFNGGKDCTVLLHLLAAVLLHLHPTTTTSAAAAPWPPIPSIYVSQPSPFPLMESFVHTSETYYTLSLHRTSGLGMKAALASYLSLRPQTTAVMVGTRRGDPHGATLEFCQPTDAGWPVFVRVHPVINWGYADVWKFLRRWEVPYCELYDQGYTSLGSTYNTHPNPALLSPSGTGFRPAYELEDESLERAGREDGVRAPLSPVAAPGGGKEDGKHGAGGKEEKGEGREKTGAGAVAAAVVVGLVGITNGDALRGKEEEEAPPQELEEEEEDVLL